MKGEIKVVSFLDVHIFSNHQIVGFGDDTKVKYKHLFLIKKQLDKCLFSMPTTYARIKTISELFSRGQF